MIGMAFRWSHTFGLFPMLPYLGNSDSIVRRSLLGYYAEGMHGNG